MLQVALQGVRRCATSLHVTVKRNLGVSAVCMQKAKLDPIQQLFVDKIREYKKQSTSGKSPGMSAEVEKELSEKLDNVTRLYNPNGEDFTKLPTFSFTEPTLSAVGVDMQAEPVPIYQAEPEPEAEEKYYFEA